MGKNYLINKTKKYKFHIESEEIFLKGIPKALI
jgi:hypothetical protein